MSDQERDGSPRSNNLRAFIAGGVQLEANP
jgi:hypothetical protein